MSSLATPPYPAGSDTVFEYDASADHWRQSKFTMHGGPRHNHGAAGIPSAGGKGQIVIIGGQIGGGAIDRAGFLFDIAKQTWEPYDLLPYRRSGHACVAMEIHELAIVRAGQ